MGFVMASMGWTSREFMDATSHEIWAAYEAWVRMNCADEEE
jgi:hypothetical protein